MELRPGYKSTEVGVIPEDWEVVDLNSISDGKAPIRYGVVQIGADNANGVPIVPIKYMREIETAQLHRAARGIEERYAGSRISANDVLISVKGTIGRIGVVPDGFSGNIAREIARIRLRPGVAPRFISAQLDASHTQRRISESVVGTTRLEFSIAAVRDFRISLPASYHEQVAIASTIRDVDLLVVGLHRLITKKRDLKQAAMQQLLTGQTRLPDFSAEWEVHQVRDVVSGYFCGPSPTCEERNISGEIEWGVLKTTAMTKEAGWNWRAHKALPRIFWDKRHLEIKVGDVLVTKAGPRHRVAVAAWVDFVPARIIPSGKMICLRPKPESATSLMLAAAIASPEAQLYIDQRTTGMAESQVNFENEVLLDAPIRLPGISEQRAIAEALHDMDEELIALEERREKTRLLKQAMMQELLTGNIRLTISEPADV